MQIKPDCIPFILNMAVSAVQRTHLEENDQKALMAEIMENKAIRGLSWNHASPELIKKDILVYTVRILYMAS